MSTGARTFVVTAVAMLVLALVVSSVQVVQAQSTEPSATTEPTAAAAPPLGDCYGGVFPQDPLHCYALEEAEREELIDVTALYVAPGGGPLYVWLNQTGPVSDAVYAFLKTKSKEFYDRWPDRVSPYLDGILDYFDGLPPTDGYEDIVLHVGGEKAQRAQRGGASWRQIWPTSTDRNGVRSAGGFDVSGVNTTDFPEIDCRFEQLGTTCERWREYPSLGVAGVTGSPNPRTVYLRFKNVPQDESEITALKNRLYPCHDTIGRCTYVQDGVTHYQYRDPENTFDVEFIPAKYDFGEIWRWATILDRFAVSDGNTIGIVAARVTKNDKGGDPSGRVYPLDDLQENPSEHRPTIIVGALDLQGAVEALPTLLPQFGIPVDAVGIVKQASRRRGYSELNIGSTSPSPVVQPVAKQQGSDGLPVGAIAGAASLVAVVALGAVVAWRRRS